MNEADVERLVLAVATYVRVNADPDLAIKYAEQILEAGGVEVETFDIDESEGE